MIFVYFLGAAWSFPMAHAECHPSCSNGGMCFPRRSRSECFCPPPFGGPACETVASPADSKLDAQTKEKTILKMIQGLSDMLVNQAGPRVDSKQSDHSRKTQRQHVKSQLPIALDERNERLTPSDYAVFSIVLHSTNPLIADAKTAAFYLWSALCNDLAPCPANILVDDIKVTVFGPAKIVFEVRPSSPQANLDAIVQDMTSQLSNPASSLAKYFPTMDAASSTASRNTAQAILPPSATTTSGPLTLDEDRISMSTTMKCILFLTFQFFLIYTTIFVLQLLQSVNWGVQRRPDLDDTLLVTIPDGEIETARPKFAFIAVLERCKSTVFFAPMLSILFLATRMRALQLTQGQGAPPLFAQDMMLAVTVAVAGQMVVILVQSSFNPNGPLRMLGVLVEMIEKGFMIMMYMGTVAIMQIVVSMTPELCLPGQEDKAAAFWPDGPPAVSPAVGAVINLTLQFFVIYLGVKIMESIETFSEKDEGGVPKKAWILTWKSTFDLAKATVNFAPMLSILFVGARMRALEIDPANGAPQSWAQTCFYVCAYGVMVQAVLVLIGPICGITAVRGAAEGDIIYKSSSKEVEIALVVARYLCLVAVYGGFSAVILSVYTIVDNNGASIAMSASTATVIELSLLYFSLYLVFLLTQTVGQLTKRPFTHPLSALKNTLTSVEFCPMLAVLCLAARMRSKEVNATGAPQGWAQDAMRLTAVAIALQVLSGLGSSICTAANQAFCSILAWLVGCVRSVALVLLYLSLVIISCSVVVISPQSANGRGSLWPDANPKNNYWETPPPFSTTILCILLLVIQFFAINGLNFVARKVCDALNIEHASSPILSVLERSKSTVFFAPMLSILFVGARMRALQLTQDQGAPQLWAQDLMQLASSAVLIQLLLICSQGAFNKSSSGGKYVSMVVDLVEKAVMVAMYCSMVGVIFAILVMSPENCLKDASLAASMWPDGPPSVSPAVGTTINLTVQFFVIYIGVKIMETIFTFSIKDVDGLPKASWIVTWKSTFDMAKATVNFAPMLCVLFIGTRMRALEIDPKNGAPQSWAQTSFYVCAYGVMLQAVMVMIGPLCGIKAVKGDIEGDVKFQSSSKLLTVVLSFVRWASLIATYGGFLVVVLSILVITDKAGNSPPLSPALQNVLIMTMQYFAVYLGVMITFSIQQLCSISLPRVMKLFMSFVLTVDLCPMLSVLYLATRMRSLEITGGAGGPPGWVQDAMYVATFAVLLQLVLAIAGSRFAVVVALQTLSWFLTLGASMLVCLGILTMVPHTATGEGSLIAPHLMS